MPFYHKLGEIPHKRHTQFRKPSGELYREELMGLEGFSSLQSTLYHNFIPPRVKAVEDLGSRLPETVDFGPIRHRAFKTADAPLGGDAVTARIPLLANRDVILGVARTLLGLRVSPEIPWPSTLDRDRIERLEVRAGVLATSVQTAEGTELTQRSPSDERRLACPTDKDDQLINR